ncbi:Cas10/Cmr2 second palm domain-containing protein [Nostoc sp.]|uniref:Cas10/Cmr2 second palm domain-containing protein n=1 Tax=Nostoc sp. TaxID=1180 RepID=UPI002FF70925
MTQFTVTVVDTTGKQNYIFNTNRLRENIGASFLLSQATKEWVEEILEENLGVPKNLQEEPIDTSELNAEIIYANGGNALIVFKSREVAVKFTRILSKKVLTEASGVNLLVAHDDFDWENSNLYTIVEDLKKNELEHQKYERIHSAPLLGLGVTASCNSTQLPAVDRSDKYIDYDDDEGTDSYLISTETRQKLKAVRKANPKLQQIFANVVDENIYQFPYRSDNLGRSEGESSYVAVVHIDGNGMGDRFKKHGEGKENRDYINAMRDFSNSVETAGTEALKAVTETLVNSIKSGRVVGKIGEFDLNKDSKSNIFYLPFRPLVYGGDDITFICEGRLGLELAALFLRKFEEQKVTNGKPLTACAGVCVVKAHYPFSRAYQMSEDLCNVAKKFVKSEQQKHGVDYFSAIDWHLAASGLLGSISGIRQREYQVNDKSWHLAMRPLWLKHDDEWRTWSGFTQVVSEFKQGDDWKERQNKIMALRDVLRKGSIEAVKEFLLNYKLPNLPLFPESSSQSEQLIKQGWNNEICGYFDAIEAMDFYLGVGSD